MQVWVQHTMVIQFHRVLYCIINQRFFSYTKKGLWMKFKLNSKSVTDTHKSKHLSHGLLCATVCTCSLALVQYWSPGSCCHRCYETQRHLYQVFWIIIMLIPLELGGCVTIKTISSKWFVFVFCKRYRYLPL